MDIVLYFSNLIQHILNFRVYVCLVISICFYFALFVEWINLEDKASYPELNVKEFSIDSDFFHHSFPNSHYDLSNHDVIFGKEAPD